MSAAVLLAALFVVSGVAQRDTLSAAAGDKYVISAKAGGVNLMEGTVTVNRKEGRSGLLLKGDRLEIGDRVTTGPDARAEILLNPGSYVRLGPNSSFEFHSTSLDDLRLYVHSGSAIFEVFADDEFTVSIGTPGGEAKIVQTGVYRVDVDGESASLEVWKGRAELAGAVVKKGREAVIGAETTAIARFDSDDKDALETWSKARSKELAKATSKLKDSTMRTSLMRSFLGRGWNVYDSFGVWVFNPWAGGHCFLPFGYGWRSPYGFGYGYHLGSYNLPPIVYYPQQTGPPVSPTLDTKSGRARTTAAAATAGPRPYQKFKGAGSPARRTRTFDSGPDFSSPVRSAPPMSSPVRMAPPPLERKPGRN